MTDQLVAAITAAAEKPMNAPDEIENRPEESPARRRLSSKQRWVFRTVAAGIPTIIGLGIVLTLLIWLQYLVKDRETGRWRLQSRPIYLQEPGHELTGHRYLYDAQLGWRNIPGWKATTLGRPLTINLRGLRGPDYDFEKPANQKRLLVLGDSYAWGYGVGDDELFTRLLDEQLKGWQVINSGVSGWGTDQQLMFLQNEGMRYSPDVVVVAFFLFNDPKNIAESIQYGLSKPVYLDANLTLGNVPVPKPSRTSANLRSDAKPIELTIAILKEISKTCQRNDCSLVVMKFGSFLGLEPDKMFRWEQELEEGLRELPEIRYLDLDEAFVQRQFTRQRLLEGNNDGHWNAFGHQETANILKEFLLEANVVGAD